MQERINTGNVNNDNESVERALASANNALSFLAKKTPASAYYEIDNALAEIAGIRGPHQLLAKKFNEISVTLSSSKRKSLQRSIVLLQRAAELAEDTRVRFKIIIQFNLVMDFHSLHALVNDGNYKEDLKTKAKDAATKALVFSKKLTKLNEITNWRHKEFYQLDEIDMAITLVIRDFDLSDAKKRVELLFTQIQHKRWALVEGLLNHRGHEIDVNAISETNRKYLIDYAISDRQPVIVKYLLLLGAHSISKHHFYSEKEEVLRPYYKSFNVAAVVLNPDNAFFRQFPVELQQLMLLSALRAEDSDLKHIPDRILLNVTKFELHKKYKEKKSIFSTSTSTKGHYLDRKKLIINVASFFVRAFRDDYPHNFTPAVIRDKRRMLTEVLEKKYNSQPITRSLYHRLSRGLSILASEDYYLTKTNTEKIIDEILLLEEKIANMVELAINQFSSNSHVAFFTLEKNCLYETVSLVLAESFPEIEWSQDVSNLFIRHLVGLLEDKMNQFKRNTDHTVQESKHHFMRFSEGSHKLLGISENDIFVMISWIFRSQKNQPCQFNLNQTSQPENVFMDVTGSPEHEEETRLSNKLVRKRKMEEAKEVQETNESQLSVSETTTSFASSALGFYHSQQSLNTETTISESSPINEPNRKKIKTTDSHSITLSRN